ncbi:protein of unknown function [Epsilonproteobacteria bacterium SCGC AD-308-P11]|nr:protein of unknown function [Epsilonproteobacteria bacterium SCGC AD-308-P11]
MPTILKIDGFRFFFFSNEHSPEHIHIEKGDTYARIELESLKVTDSYNLDSKDLKKLVALVKKNKEKLQGDWNEYFTS